MHSTGSLRPPSSLAAHATALVVFLLLSAFWVVQFQDKGAEAIRTSDTTDSFYSVVMGARDLRQPAPASLPAQLWHDQVAVWKSSDLRNLYQAQFDAYLKSVYLATGDVAAAYKMLAGPLNFIYLLGCYLLFLAVGGGRRLSLAFAVLASFPIFVPLAGESFGMGPFTNFSRRHLFTAFVPLALLLFYRYRDDMRVLPFVFAFFGLIANLHASGTLLVGIALLACFFRRPPARPRLADGALLLLASCAAGFIALGSVWKVVGDFAIKLSASIVPAAHAASVDLKAGIPSEFRYLFYPPHIYSHLPEALVHAMSAAVFCLALLTLWLRRRVSQPVYGSLLFASSLAILAFLGFSELKFWLLAALPLWLLAKDKAPTPAFELASLFILATYFVSFVPTVVFQFAYFHVADFPLVHNSLRGVRFIGLFVFVWLAALACRIGFDRLSRPARYGIVLLFSIAVFADVRHLVRDNFRRPANQGEIVSLMDAARWARYNTPADARFFVAGSAFGIVAERRIHLKDKQSRNCPACRQATLDPDRDGLLKAAMDNDMDFAVLKKARHAGTVSGALYENEHYAVLPVNLPGEKS